MLFFSAIIGRNVNLFKLYLGKFIYAMPMVKRVPLSFRVVCPKTKDICETKHISFVSFTGHCHFSKKKKNYLHKEMSKTDFQFSFQISLVNSLLKVTRHFCFFSAVLSHKSSPVHVKSPVHRGAKKINK